LLGRIRVPVLHLVFSYLHLITFAVALRDNVYMLFTHLFGFVIFFNNA
jgi:hypothetical protein